MAEILDLRAHHISIVHAQLHGMGETDAKHREENLQFIAESSTRMREYLQWLHADTYGSNPQQIVAHITEKQARYIQVLNPRDEIRIITKGKDTICKAVAIGEHCIIDKTSRERQILSRLKDVLGISLNIQNDFEYGLILQTTLLQFLKSTPQYTLDSIVYLT